MAQGGREGNTFEILLFLSISFFALSFFQTQGRRYGENREWNARI
jgi:hypothetical protein